MLENYTEYLEDPIVVGLVLLVGCLAIALSAAMFQLVECTEDDTRIMIRRIAGYVYAVLGIVYMALFIYSFTL